MSMDGKKISFSFSKVKKPPLTNKLNIEPKEKIDYVDCFDGSKGQFSFKGNVKNDESVKKELVIPMVSSKTSTDIVKSRIDEKLKNTANESGEAKSSENGSVECGKSATSIEELAASEILNELHNNRGQNKNSNGLVIQSKDPVIGSVGESSEADIDYDQVPVNDFGLAMLRGMGWKPNTGIGKEPKMVATVSPQLRPKGLGLGAKPIPEKEETEKPKKPS